MLLATFNELKLENKFGLDKHNITFSTTEMAFMLLNITGQFFSIEGLVVVVPYHNSAYGAHWLPLQIVTK